MVLYFTAVALVRPQDQIPKLQLELLVFSPTLLALEQTCKSWLHFKWHKQTLHLYSISSPIRDCDEDTNKIKEILFLQVRLVPHLPSRSSQTNLNFPHAKILLNASELSNRSHGISVTSGVSSGQIRVCTLIISACSVVPAEQSNLIYIWSLYLQGSNYYLKHLLSLQTTTPHYLTQNSH